MYLKFIGYKVNEINFKLNDTGAEVKNFVINPNIRMDIKKEAKNFTLVITTTVAATETQITPFDLNVKLTGLFRVEREGAIDLLRVEASELLFPYARSVISTLTTNANMPAYFLPVIDFKAVVAPGAAAPTDTKQGGIGNITIRPIDEV